MEAKEKLLVVTILFIIFCLSSLLFYISLTNLNITIPSFVFIIYVIIGALVTFTLAIVFILYLLYWIIKLFWKVLIEADY